MIGENFALRGFNEEEWADKSLDKRPLDSLHLKPTLHNNDFYFKNSSNYYNISNIFYV